MLISFPYLSWLLREDFDVLRFDEGISNAWFIYTYVDLWYYLLNWWVRQKSLSNLRDYPYLGQFGAAIK